MRIESILKISIIFLAGFLFANLLSFYLVYGLENPFSGNFKIPGTETKSAPFDFIKENQIEVYSDRVVIFVQNASIGRYAATGSMIPTLDEHANGIRVKPKSADDIHIGDIITFKQGDYLIIHRVVQKGVDDNGIYFVTKGDNNSLEDGKVRFSDIQYITVGMLW
jgi:hypothetical protein